MDRTQRYEVEREERWKLAKDGEPAARDEIIRQLRQLYSIIPHCRRYDEEMFAKYNPDFTEWVRGASDYIFEINGKSVLAEIKIKNKKYSGTREGVVTSDGQIIRKYGCDSFYLDKEPVYKNMRDFCAHERCDLKSFLIFFFNSETSEIRFVSLERVRQLVEEGYKGGALSEYCGGYGIKTEYGRATSYLIPEDETIDFANIDYTVSDSNALIEIIAENREYIAKKDKERTFNRFVEYRNAIRNVYKDARYSVLVSGKKLRIEDIKVLLFQGIKVIYFGADYNLSDLTNAGLKEFIDARCLLVYENSEDVDIELIDGCFKSDEEKKLKILAKHNPSFNLEQYLVEHAPCTDARIIEASAGAGKTKVMIDRIIFLMSTIDNLRFGDIAMITFTNKATDSMRQELLKALNQKYLLTGQIKYFAMMEQIPELESSTIHSFFNHLMKVVGPSLGYGTNISLRGYALEKKKILRDLMDEQYGSSENRVREELGLDIYQIENLAIDYWNKLDNKGLTEREILDLDWGNAGDTAKDIQYTLAKLFLNVNERYNDVKYRNNAISMKDILHELNRAFDVEELGDYLTKQYKYLFVDEFQDSDTVQIKIIAKLVKVYGGQLFVVGDIKQSIYRFRGANDEAFNKLKHALENEGIHTAPDMYLKKNYRTASNVLNRLHPIFNQWAIHQLIDYSGDMEAARDDIEGVYKQIVITRKNRRSIVLKEFRKILNSLSSDRKEAKQKGFAYKREKIMVLTRTNYELAMVKEWCDKETDLVCIIRERGKFFKSDAVKDFLVMCESFLYSEEPMYFYNYLYSSYSEDVISNEKVLHCEGNHYELFKYFDSLESYKQWKKYVDLFVNKPVFAILIQIIDEISPLEIYARKKKAYYLGSGKNEEEAYKAAHIDALQYQYDLNKLMNLLKDQYAGEFSSLYDICRFLRIKIATDHDTDQDVPEENLDFDYIEGMTVHSAKGLQFENVIIPFMDRPFYKDQPIDFIISPDKKSVGWKYNNGSQAMQNENYLLMETEEANSVKKDETRLLYVAMTRVIKGLYCFVTRDNNQNETWSGLLPVEEDA